MPSLYQPLSTIDTFAGSSQRAEGRMSAQGMKEVAYEITPEGTIGTFTTATLRAKWQISPYQFGGFSIGQQSSVARRIWYDVIAGGPNAALLLDGDFPDPIPLGSTIIRRLRLGGPYLARVLLMQSFTGAGASPNQPSFIITTAMDLHW